MGDLGRVRVYGRRCPLLAGPAAMRGPAAADRVVVAATVARQVEDCVAAERWEALLAARMA